ncbi:hypothetical protein CHCC20441_0084 [Bacillus licheniformis]|jgi:hypothetical protein|uniref:Uncharacterized protein n=1 Tax=Bacillus licheniformis TaxID=1402 RepID=A0A8B5YH33_BACLI|nr:hypothetical protein N399_23330 [Bacillus licheniformis CG-B52]KUL06825.1 hypothetical protein LI17339_20365 [Bacillus licheniformis LMG 17339]KYC73725.1 hypothetical protein B4092_4630 [Bacillus licheniformis]KYC78482.1 hypothetical protein B4090_4650 [Bacillus licheniformis]KYC82314.1 hypothetical protein B4091_4673 [Bacillus licheniformis]
MIWDSVLDNIETKQVKRQTTTADAKHYSPENILPKKQIKQDT